VTRELRGLLVDPIDGTRPGVLRIDGGQIASVEPIADELREPLVFPGSVDLQIYDYARCVEHGITGYLATVGTSARGVVERFLEELPDDPACLGAHVEGPYLNPEAAGAQALEHTIERIVDSGAVASIGHTATNYYTTRAAVDRGARFATHVWNAMSGFRARSPGAIGTLLADERVTLGMIADGRHLHPVTEELTFRAAGPARIALTSDMVAPPQEQPDGKLLGGDRSGAALVQRVAPRFGLQEAAAMASLTPAQVLGLHDRGRLAAGYRADLAVLAADFTPRETIMAGETAWASG
jgi:N-acetylglucosamine-6-phosphate deacetylase